MKQQSFGCPANRSFTGELETLRQSNADHEVTARQRAKAQHNTHEIENLRKSEAELQQRGRELEASAQVTNKQIQELNSKLAEAEGKRGNIMAPGDLEGRFEPPLLV